MSANPQQQSTRQQIQAEQDRQNQQANRAFLEATARGGDVKSIQALQDQGVPVVTTREGPYTRTYVGEQQVAEGIQRVQSGIYTDSSGQQQSNYGIDAGRSPYLTRVGDSYQVNPRYLQEQQNIQNQQMQTQKALQESIGPRARLELGPDGEVISSYSERMTDQGILGEERRSTKSQQTNNLADILAAPDDATFELEIGGQKKSGLTKRDVIDQYFAFEKQEKESESQIRTSLLEAKSQGTTYVYVTEGGKRKLMNIDKAIAKDFDFSQGVIVEPRQTAKQRVLMDKQDRELTAFAETAKQSGAMYIKGTSESGAVKVFPVSTFRQDVKKEKEPLTFSFEPPATRNLDTMTYADRVDAGISPKPKTIQENISYYADVAAKPIGDLFFPAAALVTGKEVKYTPSTGGKAIDALITSTKFTFGFGDKDQSGKPVDQSFPATFSPIAQEVAKDPLKVAVQIPAEIGLGIAGGGAVKAGTILTKKGIIEPVASRLVARQIETQLTKTFTGTAPRKTVTTIFKEPITQRSITRQGQEIATEVVIPITRRVDRPAITVERIKGRPDLFKVEGGKTAEIAGESTKQGTKDVYIQKVGKDLIPVVVEQPIKETPKRVVVRGQIGFTEKDTLHAMEKSGLNIQVGKKGDQFVTEGKPSREMLQLLATQVIKPTATVSQFTMKQVAENPRQFGRYFFGGESREQMQTALRNLEKPASGKPVDSFLVAETRSYGTVGSRIGTQSGKLVGTGKKALVSGLEWTEKIANPVKSNLPIISQRIQSGLKNLGTAGRKDTRLREIEERNIKGLERRKIQLAEQPAELERKVRGMGEREILKGVPESSGLRFSFGKRAIGSRRPDVFKAFTKRSRPTDSYVSDITGIGGSFTPKSKIASKTGTPFRFGATSQTKGAAGGRGRARSLLQQESKSERESSDYIPPRTRQDAFGEIADPVYLKAYPAFETATMSALEPTTLTSRRPSFTTSPAISSKSISGVDFGVIGMRSTSQTIRTDNILLSRPQEQSGMRNLEKMMTGEILKTGQTTRQNIIPILTTRITTTTIPRQTSKQDTMTLQTFRGFGVNRLAQPSFPGTPFTGRITTTFPPFGRIPRGGGGGGGFFGVGGKKGGGTALFKASVYNPLAPSLSIKEKRRGKKGERNLIF